MNYEMIKKEFERAINEALDKIGTDSDNLTLFFPTATK